MIQILLFPVQYFISHLSVKDICAGIQVVQLLPSVVDQRGVLCIFFLPTVIPDSLTLERTRRKLQFGYGGYGAYNGYGRNGYYGYMPGYGIAIVVVIVFLILVALCCSCFFRRRALKRYQNGNGPVPMFYRGQKIPPPPRVWQTVILSINSSLTSRVSTLTSRVSTQISSTQISGRLARYCAALREW